MSDETKPIEELVNKALSESPVADQLAEINAEPVAPSVPEPPARDLTAERDALCVPIAQAIVGLIGRVPMPVGPITEEQRKEYFPLAKDILVLMNEKNLTLSEVNYVLQLLVQCYDMTKNLVITSLNENLKRAEVKLWGQALDETKLQTIDAILTKT